MSVNYTVDARRFLFQFKRRELWADVISLFAPAARRQRVHYETMFANDIEAVAHPFVRGFGRLPNFANPRSFSEKLRSLLLTHPNPLMAMVADKRNVRQFHNRFARHLTPTPLIAVYDKFDDIEFEALPETYVIKVSDGAGMQVVSSPQSPRTPDEARKALAKWRYFDHWRQLGELQYRANSRSYVVEEYLPIENEEERFNVFCILGEPVWLWREMNVVRDAQYRLARYGPDGVRQDGLLKFSDAPQAPEAPPDDFDLMMEEARNLAAPFLHARIDFLKHDGRLHLTEVTLTTDGLRRPLAEPEKYAELAERLDLSKAEFYLAEGRRIAAQLGQTARPTFGHFAGDPRLNLEDTWRN